MDDSFNDKFLRAVQELVLHLLSSDFIILSIFAHSTFHSSSFLPSFFSRLHPVATCFHIHHKGTCNQGRVPWASEGRYCPVLCPDELLLVLQEMDLGFGCPGKEGAEQARGSSAPSSIVLSCEWTVVLWLLLQPLAKSLYLPGRQIPFPSHHCWDCSLTLAGSSSPWTAADTSSLSGKVYCLVHSVHQPWVYCVFTLSSSHITHLHR